LEKLHYTYDLFVTDTKTLIEKCTNFQPDIILAVARGGLTLSHFMAQTMNIRNLFSINSIHYNDETKLDTFEIFNIPDLSNAKRVLIVDDIVDSGETMVEILKILNNKFPNVEFKIATLFYKKTALIQPDFSVKEANCWIDFFWEVDI
jgi:xanthine phosphoribosyltransferase